MQVSLGQFHPASPSPAFLLFSFSASASKHLAGAGAGSWKRHNAVQRMFLCSPQAAQNRDLQKGPHKGSFLPPQPSEKLGEILAYLPSPALNKTETIKKEGEGATETLAKFVFVVLFVGLGFFWVFF